MSGSSPSTDGSTPAAPVVNPSTASAPGVNTAQTQQQIPSSAPYKLTPEDAAQYEKRIQSLMSEKDRALNERNKAISDLTNLQNQYTTAQEQTQSSLTAAANSAQQAIDRNTTVERELVQERARSAKLAALIQRPHLAPYASLIPDVADETKLKEVLDQLEQIRSDDLKRSAPAIPTLPSQQQQPQNPLANQASTLQALYGNRANMNPAFMQPAVPIPASSPAQMNPAASTDVVSAINQIYADARRLGTQEAFEDATKRASLLANSANPLAGR